MSLVWAWYLVNANEEKQVLFSEVQLVLINCFFVTSVVYSHIGHSAVSSIGKKILYVTIQCVRLEEKRKQSPIAAIITNRSQKQVMEKGYTGWKHLELTPFLFTLFA